MRYAVVLLMLLFADPSFAGMGMGPGPGLSGSGCTPSTGNVTAINGVSALSSDGGATDTGTQTITTARMCPATISYHAACAADDYASVQLVINGVTVHTTECELGESKDETVTYSVAGAYTARIVGEAMVDGSFNADSFVFPH